MVQKEIPQVSLVVQNQAPLGAPFGVGCAYVAVAVYAKIRFVSVLPFP